MLETVRSSLSDTKPAQPAANGAEDGDAAPEQFLYSEDAYAEETLHWEDDANEVVFDDTGEGAGVEGDLDMDDD